jgi:ribosomal protein S18 acetylase RimI-like enzyme
MITFKRMSACTLNESLTAWNNGFEDYIVNVQMNEKQFLSRVISEDLCPQRSFIAFDGQQPVGLLLNGFRTELGKTYAWNGGTAVSPKYRGQKIASQLIEQSLALYKDEKVDIALLEAIKGNANAIQAYEKFGYKIIDRLQFQQQKGDVAYLQQLENESTFTFEENAALMVRKLGYFNTTTAWQTQISSIKDGRVLELKIAGNSAAYVLYKEGYNIQGSLAQIIIYQCEVNDEYKEFSNPIIEQLLKHLFQKADETVTKMAFNLSEKNVAIHALKKFGFTLTLEQVHMKRDM